jgi:hypothetical protein
MRCLYCGCDPENDPCRLPDSEECGWLNALKICCTNSQCVLAYDRECKSGAMKSADATRDGQRQALEEWKKGVVQRRERRTMRRTRPRKVKGRAA